MPAKIPAALPVRAELTPALVASTIKNARALPGFKRHVVADEEQAGLILVIGKRTAKWALRYRPRGFRLDGSRFEPTYFVIGDVAIFSPVAARAEVGILRSRIEKGENPTAERAKKRAEKAAGQASVRTEAERRADMIAALIDADLKGSFVPEFSTLSGATLDQCAAAFKLYGNFGGVRAKSRAETLMHVRLGLAEMDAGGMLPGDLKTFMVKSLTHHHAASPATGCRRAQQALRMAERERGCRREPGRESQAPTPTTKAHTRLDRRRGPWPLEISRWALDCQTRLSSFAPAAASSPTGTGRHAPCRHSRQRSPGGTRHRSRG